MNQINPKKLKQSKWTAKAPKNKEKHFVVTKVVYNPDDGTVEQCFLEAVMSQRTESIDWQQLKNSDHWAVGWK